MINLPSISVVKSDVDQYYDVYTAVATWDGEVHTSKEAVRKDGYYYPDMEHNIKKAVAHQLLEFLLEKMK